MYERIMEMNDVPREQWAKFLGPQLSVKATRAFLCLSSDEARNYDVAKREILNYFQLDSKSYLHAFRTARRQGRETYRMCLSKLKDLQRSYYESANITDFDSLSDAMLSEQLFNLLPPNVREFVYAKRPINSEQIAAEADLAFQCSKVNATQRIETTNRGGVGVNLPSAPQNRHQFTPRFVGAKTSHAPIYGHCHGPGARFSQQMSIRPPTNQRQQRERTCWVCNQPGHTSRQCPQQRFCYPNCPLCGKNHSPQVACPNGKTGNYACQQNPITFDAEYAVPICINNVMTNGLRDTGHNGMLIVDPSLVEKEQYLEKNCKNARCFFTGN